MTFAARECLPEGTLNARPPFPKSGAKAKAQRFHLAFAGLTGYPLLTFLGLTWLRV